MTTNFDGRSQGFHTALNRYQDRYIIAFGKRYQRALGVSPNDCFQIKFFKDSSKYGVEMPGELNAVLDRDRESQEIFTSLTVGKIRSVNYAISKYKNAQTGIDKSLLLTENLKPWISDPGKLFRVI